MPNPEHIAKLKEGVEAWNAWRDENPDVMPDLVETNLSGADLFNATLTGATLFKADGLDSDQLCSTSSLVNALLDEDLKIESMKRCPEKFKEKES